MNSLFGQTKTYKRTNTKRKNKFSVGQQLLFPTALHRQTNFQTNNKTFAGHVFSFFVCLSSLDNFATTIFSSRQFIYLLFRVHRGTDTTKKTADNSKFASGGLTCKVLSSYLRLAFGVGRQDFVLSPARTQICGTLGDILTNRRPIKKA